MRPRRTHDSNGILRMPGGNEDQDLWFTHCQDAAGNFVIATTWVPSEEERERIAAGENVELLVWGDMHPPVGVGVTDVEIGKAPA